MNAQLATPDKDRAHVVIWGMPRGDEKIAREVCKEHDVATSIHTDHEDDHITVLASRLDGHGEVHWVYEMRIDWNHHLKMWVANDQLQAKPEEPTPTNWWTWSGPIENGIPAIDQSQTPTVTSWPLTDIVLPEIRKPWHKRSWQFMKDLFWTAVTGSPNRAKPLSIDDITCNGPSFVAPAKTDWDRIVVSPAVKQKFDEYSEGPMAELDRLETEINKLQANIDKMDEMIKLLDEPKGGLLMPKEVADAVWNEEFITPVTGVPPSPDDDWTYKDTGIVIGPNTDYSRTYPDPAAKVFELQQQFNVVVDDTIPSGTYSIRSDSAGNVMIVDPDTFAQMKHL